MKKLLIIAMTALLICGISVVAMAADVHSVVAQKPFILVDGLTGTSYNVVNGTCSMNWKEKTRYGFFNAKVKVMAPLAPIEYEFQLIAIGNASDTEIEGLWDIKRNGILVASGIVGKLYGIDQPVGSYFKFYGGDSQNNTMAWHLAAYITYRCDY